MFGRRDSSTTEPSDALPPEDGVPAGSKGRPTPSRREAERIRRERSRVPAGRKEAAAWERQRRREAREATRQAMLAGDEKAMPERDRGPVRRFVRDTVDSRHAPGEYFLYLAFLVLGLTFVRSPAAQALGFLAIVTGTFLIVVDSAFLIGRLRKLLRVKFPGADTSGAVTYGVLRSVQVRRLRLPPPQVSPRQARRERKRKKKSADS